MSSIREIKNDIAYSISFNPLTFEELVDQYEHFSEEGIFMFINMLKREGAIYERKDKFYANKKWLRENLLYKSDHIWDL